MTSAQRKGHNEPEHRLVVRQCNEERPLNGQMQLSSDKYADKLEHKVNEVARQSRHLLEINNTYINPRQPSNEAQPQQHSKTRIL